MFFKESVFNIFRDSLKNKLQIALIYNNLGILYLNTNQNKKAIHYFLQSLRLKKGDKTVYATYGNLALSYEKEDDINKAEYYYSKALESIDKNYGTNNIWYAQQLLNNGQFLYSSKKEFSESLKNLEKALAIYIEKLGVKNPETARAYSKIGEYYLKTGNYKTSLLYFQKSLIALSDNFNDTNYITNPDIKLVTFSTKSSSSSPMFCKKTAKSLPF